MHKKLAADLTDLAHKILRISDKDDVILLKETAYEVYEKLAVLAYIEEYVNTTPQATQTKDELIAKIENAENQKNIELVDSSEEIESSINPIFTEVIEEKAIIEDKTEPIITEEPLEDIITQEEDNKKFDETSFIEELSTPTLEDELKDTISVDVAADLFTKADSKKSLNDHLQQSLQIGLNDRIAFVKHLFNGNQPDYNRVISQLNTLNSEKEAKKFINKNIKPDYDWSDKEEYENRLLEIIERRFA